MGRDAVSRVSPNHAATAPTYVWGLQDSSWCMALLAHLPRIPLVLQAVWTRKKLLGSHFAAHKSGPV